MKFLDKTKQLFSSNKQLITPSTQLSAAQKRRIKKMSIDLALHTDYLTRKDIRSWRNAWQMAINVQRPDRKLLYDIYNDCMVDLHLSGCIEQRKNMVLKKSFRLVGKDGKEDKHITEIFETSWFKDFMNLVLDSKYWGHSLIEFGDVVDNRFSYVSLVPRKHVIPEYGIILHDVNDSFSSGIDYRGSDLAAWCIEAGDSHDLGLLLKCAPSCISKRHMLSFWDGFGEIFGTPVRIAKTASRDKADEDRIESMLENMGSAAWGVFPEGTEIQFLESSRGDAFNVYDKRINCANSEISKCIVNQTMTIDSGSSLSQAQVHLEIFYNVIEKDANFLREVINDRLIPFMCMHGFPLENYTFRWNKDYDTHITEMQQVEQMLLSSGYDIDAQYFIDKYNIPITGRNTADRMDFFA